MSIAVTLPFDGASEIFGLPGWDLDLSSFIVPALLVHAFEISQDTRYLEAAVDYVVAWAEFESSLFLPRGLVFNDHATAARAIILTEVWRAYRNSSIYERIVAAKLVAYVGNLRQLLSKPKLFEFRTNHGFMQALSLLHLSLAFPGLEGTEDYTSLAMDRLLMKLPYHLSTEGLILEHSAGYHLNGLYRLAAMWRYFGLFDRPVPEDLADRYAKSLKIATQLLRPDKTLPPIGDTRTRLYDSHVVASLDEQTRVARYLKPVDLEAEKPVPAFIASASGLAVLWKGLDVWPTPKGLSQTVVHWGNFVTQSHKHADEMGISLWADGNQWIRAIGSWPYDRTRRRAISWRSSNAPHWTDEARLAERNTVLNRFGTGGEVDFLEMVRRNADGSEIRRQLVLVDGYHWVVLDSYHSDEPREAEVVWRFSPGVTLERTEGSEVYRLESDLDSVLIARFIPNEEWRIEPDPDGEAKWNSGVVSDREIVPSPAIRGISSGTDLAIATVFSKGELGSHDGATLWWQSSEEWSLRLGHNPAMVLQLRRNEDNLHVTSLDGETEDVQLNAIDESATALEQENQAYLEMTERFGEPIKFSVERRMKVSIAIMLAGLSQLLVFLLIRIRFSRLWLATLGLSLSFWLGLSLFLQFSFLA
jgi:hypothetical protein